MMKRQTSLKYRKQKVQRRQVNKKLAVGLAGLIIFCALSVQLNSTILYEKIKYQTCYGSLKNISPILMNSRSAETNQTENVLYQFRSESELDYDVVLEQEAWEENQKAAETAVVEENEKKTEKKTSVAYDKLKDFDYLIQNYYTVDKMTTITSAQLDVEELLEVDCTLTADSSKPQILIYHTHSQEGYKDSKSGDTSTTVVGVGEYLAKILSEKYGYSVIHHTGAYDKIDRNNAYTNAAPAIEKILSENPSIEVVIDLHRDGVAEGTRLVTEIDGKSTAQIMFFNGLSRTTAVGDIDYLYNPYIQENLAFSLQLQIASVEEYPGLARKIYLKGYRYNLHFKPKSLLVEVGAQTNTVEEAKNAMEPLAQILNEVLSGN